jgi:hypothetical protein
LELKYEKEKKEGVIRGQKPPYPLKIFKKGLFFAV